MDGANRVGLHSTTPRSLDRKRSVTDEAEALAAESLAEEALDLLLAEEARTAAAAERLRETRALVGEAVAGLPRGTVPWAVLRTLYWHTSVPAKAIAEHLGVNTGVVHRYLQPGQDVECPFCGRHMVRPHRTGGNHTRFCRRYGVEQVSA
jgi:hypothetical protein